MLCGWLPKTDGGRSYKNKFGIGKLREMKIGKQVESKMKSFEDDRSRVTRYAILLTTQMFIS